MRCNNAFSQVGTNDWCSVEGHTMHYSIYFIHSRCFAKTEVCMGVMTFYRLAASSPSIHDFPSTIVYFYSNFVFIIEKYQIENNIRVYSISILSERFSIFASDNGKRHGNSGKFVPVHRNKLYETSSYLSNALLSSRCACDFSHVSSPSHNTPIQILLPRTNNLFYSAKFFNFK